MAPMSIKKAIARYWNDSILKTWPKILALEAMIPGQPKPAKVEKINQNGKNLAILAKPTKMLSPRTRAYRSISILMKNWKVIPKTAPQIIPRPKLETRYGHKMTSPDPRPRPKIIKLGPRIFKKEEGGWGRVAIL